jgi:hypothetical protein
MDRARARQPNPWERRTLHRMKRQLGSLVNSRHARIVLLSRGGVRNRQIAQQVDCTPQWVRTILHRFNAGGIEAIAYYPYFRAPCGPYKFFADIVEQIAEVALSSPQVLIGMNQWSLPKLRAPTTRPSGRNTAGFGDCTANAPNADAACASTSSDR